MVEWVEIGDARLACGDCLDLLPTLGPVDAVVTDPPYGMNFENHDMGKSEIFSDIDWDKRPIWHTLSALRHISRHQIVWGGNYLSDILPQAAKWLVWDKQTAGVTSFADCELAWTNLDGCTRLFTFLWSGNYMKVKQQRFHPTQKPVQLMNWCLQQLPVDEGGAILDPFMGSGTTGVACAKLGRKFIGIEIGDRYFDIACKRIEEAYRQPDMFIEPPAKAVQETLI